MVALLHVPFFVHLSVLQNLADHPIKARYVLATDSSKDSLMRITRKVSQMLGTGKVKVVDRENAMLNRDITVRDFHGHETRASSVPSSKRTTTCS